jgi:two-component sensor histidine kinase
LADSVKEISLQATISDLRGLLTQAGVDAARLLEQAGIEATESEAARRLQRLLLEELHHRVKNTLAVVTAIVSQSLRNSESLEQGRLAVENRLMALGRAQDLLMQANWARAKLADVIRTAVEPFNDEAGSRFSIQDTTAEIDASAVLAMTMSLNELCTNATKYGALSVAKGRIFISLKTDEESKRFRLTWRETGGPPVRPPVRHSFGTRLIGQLASQLHGDARLDYEPEGVVYELAVPAAALLAQTR